MSDDDYGSDFEDYEEDMKAMPKGEKVLKHFAKAEAKRPGEAKAEAKRSGEAKAEAKRPKPLDPRVKRARMVREQLKLSSERFVVFEQMPLSDNQLYRQRLRSKEARFKEARTCTSDNARTIEQQTDVVEKKDASVQYDDDVETGTPDLQRLPAVLRHVAPAVVAVLEEVHGATNDEWTALDRGDLPPATAVVFSRLRPATLLVLHEEDASRVQVSVWDTSFVALGGDSGPRHILRGEGGSATAALASSSIAVVAGTECGLVELWDLREDGLAYSTACLSGTTAAHTREIVDIMPDADGGLVSLDARGLACFWIVVDCNANVDDDDDEAFAFGSQANATLRLTLTRACVVWCSLGILTDSSRWHIDTDILADVPQKWLDDTLPDSAVVCAADCSSEGHIVVAVADGKAFLIGEETRCYDGKCCPTAVGFSQFIPELFLIGQMDGGVRLHHVEDELPLAWFENEPDFVPVAALEWSTHRPALFYALYADGQLNMFDATRNSQVMERHHLTKDTGSRRLERRPSLSLASGKSTITSKLMAITLNGDVHIRHLGENLQQRHHRSVEEERDELKDTVII